MQFVATKPVIAIYSDLIVTVDTLHPLQYCSMHPFCPVHPIASLLPILIS